MRTTNNANQELFALLETFDRTRDGDFAEAKRLMALARSATSAEALLEHRNTIAFEIGRMEKRSQDLLSKIGAAIRG